MSVRVLVDDDEPDVEVLFRPQFRREVRDGLYALDCALSRQTALDSFAGCVGDDIILQGSEINMAGMSGLEWLPEVKQRRSDLPVFVIAADRDSDTAATALARVSNKFMTKSGDFPESKEHVSIAGADARGHG